MSAAALAPHAAPACWVVGLKAGCCCLTAAAWYPQLGHLTMLCPAEAQPMWRADTITSSVCKPWCVLWCPTYGALYSILYPLQAELRPWAAHQPGSGFDDMFTAPSYTAMVGTAQEDAQDVVELVQACLLDETGLHGDPANYGGRARRGKQVLPSGVREDHLRSGTLSVVGLSC